MKARQSLADDPRKRQLRGLQPTDDGVVHGAPHLWPVALMAIGHPGQVEPGHQGQAHFTVALQGRFAQRFITKDLQAVHRGHQGRGVGHHDVMGVRRPGDVHLLGLRDERLLVLVRCAALFVAPQAQPLGDPGAAQAGGAGQVLAQRLGQPGLARAFCPQHGDDQGPGGFAAGGHVACWCAVGGVSHRATLELADPSARRRQARHPATDSTANTA